MENVITKNLVSTSEEIFSKNLLGEIDADIILPDYFPDISQILKSNCSCEVVSKSIKNSVLSLEIAYNARVYYVCDEKNLHCAEHRGRINLSCDTSIHEEEEKSTIIMCSCLPKFLNCKAAGPRRLLLRGEVGAEVSLISSKKEEAVCQGKSKNLQLKLEKESLSKLIESGIYLNDLSTEVSLKKSSSNAGEVICFDSFPRVYECDCLGGKIIVKGDIFLNCLIKNLEDEENPIKADFTVPFSEIITCEEAEDDCEAFVCARLCDLTLQPSSFSSSDSADYALNGRLILYYNIMSKKECLLAKDCYHTKNICTAEKKELSFLHFIKKLDENKTLRESIKLPFDAEKIVYSLCEASYKDFVVSENELTIKYCLNLTLFVKKPGGELLRFPFTKEDEIKTPLEKGKGKICFRGGVSCLSFSTSLLGKNQVELKAELKAQGFVYSVFKETVISSITKGEKKEKPYSGGCLKIYFASPKEKIWDIGKKYNTSVSAIAEENGITSDSLAEKTMLIIPIL